MGELDKKLESMGYPLSRMGPEGKIIESLTIDGTTCYVSGQVPMDGQTLVGKGKVPSQVSVEEATKHAALCAANGLRRVIGRVGSLDRVERVLRVTGYVNSEPDFTDHHLVIHGATNLLLDLFGDKGKHARTALGMAQLPLGSSVEVEMILKLKPLT
ncbi:MAG: RidA family protein [Tepidisphaeraceae bacterium]